MAMEVPAEAAVMLALDFIQPFTFALSKPLVRAQVMHDPAPC